MALRIALAGNPNCGKSTTFNSLTGDNQYVGNWPGVTVEKKEGFCTSNKEIAITDLPGVYSLSPYTPEEVVAREYLLSGDADVVVNLIDATNLERSLYLTSQILDLGIPVVIGLNMMDLVVKTGDVIDTAELSRSLGCPVIELSALREKGLDDLIKEAQEAAKTPSEKVKPLLFDAPIEEALDKAGKVLSGVSSTYPARWLSVKAIEGEEDTLATLSLTEGQKQELSAVRAGLEEQYDGEDIESLLTAERYASIARATENVFTQAVKARSFSQKIDRVVTSKWLSVPLFVVVMTFVYYLAITVGTGVVTDWANDGISGDGFLYTGRAAYEQAVEEYEGQQEEIDAFLEAAEKQGLDTEAFEAAREAQSADEEQEDGNETAAETDKDAEGKQVAQEVKSAETSEKAISAEGSQDAHNTAGGEGVVDSEEGEVAVSSESADQVISDFIEEAQKANVKARIVNEETGEVTVIDAERFAADLEGEEPDASDGTWGLWLPGLGAIIGNALADADVAPWLQSLIMDGVVSGVGAVIGFVPQMIILFLLLGILEGCGYLARVAFVMDRVFRRFGLSGKSFIPMLIASGCGVPAVMATKTIENEKDRRMTIMTTTMVPCGAKMPIIALVFGAVAGGNTEHTWWVTPLFYFLAIVAIIMSCVMLKKTSYFASDTTPFIMELPAYQVPALKMVVQSTWDRIKGYVIKAGTVIFLSTVVIWLLMNLGDSGSGFGLLNPEQDNYLQYSLLAAIGNAISWIFAPLGFGDWQATVTSFTGLIAKENVVATVGVITSLGEVGEADPTLWSAFASMMNNSTPAILAFCAFNLLCAPCVAAIAVIWQQMADSKWALISVGFMTAFGWLVGLMIYQFGGLLTGELSFNFWTVAALATAALMLFQLFRPQPRPKQEVAE